MSLGDEVSVPDARNLNDRSRVAKLPVPGFKPDYGAVLDCVMACSGRPGCPWACTVLTGQT